ncbi:dihydroxyacetone kinase [Pseudomonas sp. JUb42]|jgi:dihydroxyacetone kinase|uniref:dihydroxyacetone kinase family protein n=1 Tax=Pseudomonas sp. JUb42 TaxID=2940611 RepID=UPI00216AA434|nr:dihydroxyacetone kinase family protein [Pseudomonas sp. JUb42]MCS3470946.1 dihydroxyacetone kinase [Pseudomonas sp. JUb42]
MTRLFNQPSAFASELLEGFVAAHRDKVRQVPGGVIRSTQYKPGEVAVVIGGGSGHYPAFAGLVGQGLAHAAVMGNLFASPSAQQIYGIARTAQKGGGVLLGYGNYAGDVLHFGLAKDRLNAEGIPCEVIAVTDDISSASIDERHKRRGIAGDLVVFKVAAASSEAGYDFTEVVRVARHANARTRSLGVAFSGCTLPGAEHPLFDVPKGRMALGMGIHGEPGISEGAVPSADELAQTLVSSLLNELPDGITQASGQRVAVILNGLGSIKYEELFVLYRRIAQLLDAAGLTVVEPEVGELVTSFDMAGLSLTLCWLDAELEAFWCAPTLTPAYRKGSLHIAQQEIEDAAQFTEQQVIPPASAKSRRSAHCVMQALEAMQRVVVEQADELGRIDAVAGDGDHGIGMQRGIIAAVGKAREALALNAGVGTLLRFAADAWADEAGGTSGAIWGVLLTALGTSLGDRLEPDAISVADGIGRASDGIQHFGKAQVGDKTMVDVLVPFSAALSEAAGQGLELHQAWRIAAQVASAAATATAQLRPRIGRARPLAEKSLGTPDAGAVSLALIINAIEPVLWTGTLAPRRIEETVHE